jgi:hypothetical protein
MKPTPEEKQMCSAKLSGERNENSVNIDSDSN